MGIAVNGDPVFLVDKRKSAWRHLEEVRTCARNVERDGIAWTAIGKGPIEGAGGADVAPLSATVTVFVAAFAVIRKDSMTEAARI